MNTDLPQRRFFVSWSWVADGRHFTPNPPIVGCADAGQARTLHRKVREDPYGAGGIPDTAEVAWLDAVVTEQRFGVGKEARWRALTSGVPLDVAVCLFDHRPSPDVNPYSGQDQP